VEAGTGSVVAQRTSVLAAPAVELEFDEVVAQHSLAVVAVVVALDAAVYE
jgi:hypothetical protein